MDHNHSVKYKLTERLGVQKPVWRTKADFWLFLSSKGWLGPRVGPWGLAHFSQNKEQGFHVRNWATAMDQLTSLNLLYHLFTACLGNSPSPLIYPSMHGSNSVLQNILSTFYPAERTRGSKMGLLLYIRTPKITCYSKAKLTFPCDSTQEPLKE